jgi:hypothetical protein
VEIYILAKQLGLSRASRTEVSNSWDSRMYLMCSGSRYIESALEFYFAMLPSFSPIVIIMIYHLELSPSSLKVSNNRLNLMKLGGSLGNVPQKLKKKIDILTRYISTISPKIP